MSSKDILFVPHPHFDPTWRRCFDRAACRHDVVVRSYAEIEELCIDEWLKIANEGYPFSDGQTAIWRKYLERNPGKKEALQREAKRGTLDLVLAGEVVPDSNMPAAEGLIRNFLLAWPLYEELAGPDHPGLKLAWLEDAFGNSANYPQILAGVGAEVVCATTYKCCPEPVWTGIDGTSLLCYDHYPAVRQGAFDKHPPCPQCAGRGCEKCNQTGLLLAPGFNLEKIRIALEEATTRPEEWVVVTYLTEELLPDERMIQVIADFNLRHEGKAQARFANPSDIYRRFLPELKAAKEARNPDTVTQELNPAMPGCMVTRIRCKQRTRSVAYLLLAAEAEVASQSWRARSPNAPSEAMTHAWRDVCFNQFHDAITGTHIDSAYVELMEMLDRAEDVANSSLRVTAQIQPLLEPLFTPAEKGPMKAVWNGFELTFDRTGIHSLILGGTDLFGVLPGASRLKRPYRIAELVLAPDFGDAWGQRIAPLPDIANEVSQIALGDYQTEVEIAPYALRWKGTYSGGDPKVAELSWTVTASLSEDGRRIDFVTEVDWNTSSRRLRVLVPVASQEDAATYEIPFGFIDRKFDREKLDYSQWHANSMEFPALHWVRKSVTPKSGVAILNKGLPCFRWMPGRFDFSLLRSPEWAFCVVEPGNYEFWDIDGQRDTGHHRFEYSLWPYCTPVTEHELTATGYAYNRPGPLPLPFQLEGNAIVSAWKESENGQGWIVRLQNTLAEPSVATLRFEEAVEAIPTDLLERPTGEARTGSEHQVSLHRHGIRTLLLRPALS